MENKREKNIFENKDRPPVVKEYVEDKRQPDDFVKVETTWGSIFDRFKKSLGIFKDTSLKSDLEKKQQEEMEAMEKITTKEGVNFSRCQMKKIIEGQRNGRKIEFESFSPYLSDYNMATGEIWEDKLTKGDAIGIAIGKVLRESFPQARLISLYDEYNSEIPDSADPTGKPIVEGSQIVFPEETKLNFRKSLEEIMRKKGLVRGNDEEGKDFLFVSESSKTRDATALVSKLEEVGKIKHDGQAIYFVNPDAENPEYREITLRTTNGRWLCEALDASAFIKPENLEVTHLVVLPDHFKKQQDKVWEILRILGIESDNYHNIFYNEDMPPGKAAEIIRKEIERNM